MWHIRCSVYWIDTRSAVDLHFNIVLPNSYYMELTKTPYHRSESIVLQILTQEAQLMRVRSRLRKNECSRNFNEKCWNCYDQNDKQNTVDRVPTLIRPGFNGDNIASTINRKSETAPIETCPCYSQTDYLTQNNVFRLQFEICDYHIHIIANWVCRHVSIYQWSWLNW